MPILFVVLMTCVLPTVSHASDADILDGCCQTNANRSQFPGGRWISGCAEFPPFFEGGGTVELEDVPAGETAFLVEMIGDGGVDGGKRLQTSHAPEPEHGPLSSSQRQVGGLD